MDDAEHTMAAMHPYIENAWVLEQNLEVAEKRIARATHDAVATIQQQTPDFNNINIQNKIGEKKFFVLNYKLCKLSNISFD